MFGTKLTGLAAFGAAVVLAGTVTAAQAQMWAPMPPPMMAPPQQAPAEVEYYSDSPKVEPGDNPANWSARQNVAESRRYEQLVHTDPAFRAARIRKECGTVSDPAEFQRCAESFN
jgi:ABC-type transport system substrate-binding protein